MKYILLVGSMIAILASACIVDSDDRCSKNQQLTTDGAGCICNDGHVPADDGNGCDPCGEHEVAAGLLCQCAPEFQRDAATGLCIDSALGRPCSDDSDCIWDDVSLCRNDVCTFTCSDTDPCPPYWWCRDDEVLADTKSCSQPIGMGDSCDHNTAGSCSGDADFCTFNPATSSASCALVCDGTPAICDDLGIACCDLTAFLGVSLCVEPADCPTL